jgi:hypothetical protein
MRKQALLLLFLLFAVVCQAQTVYKTKTGAKYHMQTCHYRKSSIETTVANAQAEGLTACSVCRPSAGTTGNTVAPKAYESSSVSSKSNSSSGSRQCSATTKAGARCKRMTTSSSGRCYQH